MEQQLRMRLVPLWQLVLGRMEFSKEIFVSCLGCFNGRFSSREQLRRWRNLQGLKAVCRSFSTVLHYIGNLGGPNEGVLDITQFMEMHTGGCHNAGAAVLQPED